MGFASTAMTAGSMALSAIQAKKQRKAAKAAAAAQEAAMNEATEEQRRQYEEKKALYGPIEEKLVAEAKSDVPLAYTRQAQEIEKQVSEAQRGMLGRPYGSGVLRSTQENLLLREAEAKAGAYGSALDQQRAMRMQLTQFNPSNQLGAQYADAMNKKSIALADMYGQQRQQAEAAEGAAWQSAIQGAGQLARMYDKMRRKEDERDPGPGGGGGSSQYLGDYGTDSGYNLDGTLKERDKNRDNLDINPYGYNSGSDSWYNTDGTLKERDKNRDNIDINPYSYSYKKSTKNKKTNTKRT
jgi:hypothetical protein